MTDRTTNRSYTAGHFELMIDGAHTSSYLKSVEGGFPKTQPMEEATGTFAHGFKHGGLMKIDPFTVDIGASTSGPMFQWIQSSWRDNDWTRRNGQITHADFNMKQTIVHEFTDALIQETTFPPLDGSSKEGAYVKVKFLPEHVKISAEEGAQVQPMIGKKQKAWSPAAFRFSLEGIEELDMVNKVESFTVKQQVKEFYCGQERFPQLIPNKIVFPTLKIQIAASHAKGLIDWSKQVFAGKREKVSQKSGSIEFLTPDRASTLFRINLYEVVIVSCQVMQANANADQIKRVQAELAVGRMDLDGEGMGLEAQSVTNVS